MGSFDSTGVGHWSRWLQWWRRQVANQPQRLLRVVGSEDQGAVPREPIVFGTHEPRTRERRSEAHLHRGGRRIHDNETVAEVPRHAPLLSASAGATGSPSATSYSDDHGSPS